MLREVADTRLKLLLLLPLTITLFFFIFNGEKERVIKYNHKKYASELAQRVHEACPEGFQFVDWATGKSVFGISPGQIQVACERPNTGRYPFGDYEYVTIDRNNKEKQ